MLRIIGNSCGWLSQKLNIIAYLTAENLAFRQQLLAIKRKPDSPEAQGAGPTVLGAVTLELTFERGAGSIGIVVSEVWLLKK